MSSLADLKIGDKVETVRVFVLGMTGNPRRRTVLERDGDRVRLGPGAWYCTLTGWRLETRLDQQSRIARINGEPVGGL